MEIILMRHGEPEYRGAGKMSYREMVGWIDSYNRSSTGRDRPSEMAQILAYRALTFLSSPLPRALSSLKTLGCEPGLIDEVFREAELQVFRIPGFRLSPFYWAALFRVLWLCGLSGESERVSAAKERAVKAAEILVNVAKDSDGPVLLMGHGVINRFIAKELIASGWKEQTRLLGSGGLQHGIAAHAEAEDCSSSAHASRLLFANAECTCQPSSGGLRGSSLAPD
ncbi:histidine phosphatase family protein [Enterobacter roggenkampii]|uniref:histidine phosphatase family protein n=1 Tax=Enterobacter roggenkampii TaxID=1812935 RepID=UPI0030FF1AFC